MSKRTKTHIVKNSTNTGYESFLEINGTFYKQDCINTVERVNGNLCTRSMYSVDTGEMLNQVTYDVISRNNSRIHMFMNCFEVAKDKNVPRQKIVSNGKHIFEQSKELSDYLQISTGSGHDKRGIVVADIDIDIKENSSDIETLVKNVLNKHFDNMNTMSIPLPSAYQIHLTNGHVQIYWVLEEEIIIKKQKQKIIKDGNIKRKELYFENTPNWNAYQRLTKFMAYFVNGDLNFTGWQIKNPYVNDSVFKNDFKTFWLHKDSETETYVETEPNNIVKYVFNELHESAYHIMCNPKKVDIFLNIIGKGGISKEEKQNLVEPDFYLSKKVQEKFGIHKEQKKTDIKEGRNQFVRMKTYEYVRLYKNSIAMDKCRKMVKAALEYALKENESDYLHGTKHYTKYTDTEFERDFSNAYLHATTTYNSYTGYTNIQRKHAKMQLRDKKNVRHMAMLAVLTEHPELIPSNKHNNTEIMRLIYEYDSNIKIASANTIATYKKELDIKDTQKKILAKNYRKTDIGYEKRIKRKEELLNLYSEINQTMTNEKKKEWNKRLKSITGTMKTMKAYNKHQKK